MLNLKYESTKCSKNEPRIRIFTPILQRIKFIFQWAAVFQFSLVRNEDDKELQLNSYWLLPKSITQIKELKPREQINGPKPLITDNCWVHLTMWQNNVWKMVH